MKHVTPDFELVEKESKLKKKVDRSGWEYAASPGVYLLVPILAGLAFGLWLDTAQGTKPLYTLIFLIAGAVSSVYNLSKLTRNN